MRVDKDSEEFKRIYIILIIIATCNYALPRLRTPQGIIVQICNLAPLAAIAPVGGEAAVETCRNSQRIPSLAEQARNRI